ncbi:MAG TPA: c-type cytochrome [Pyrinomonadaceae bacterium]|jgi:cytochrome c2
MRGKVQGLKLLVAGALICATLGGAACSQLEAERAAAAMTNGDPQRGQAAITRYGCATCHTIPGIRGADALVGPPLTQMAGRSYIAGVLPNAPENMVRWLKDPPQVDRLTAMPNLGVTDADARDIAAYLYTLR